MTSLCFSSSKQVSFMPPEFICCRAMSQSPMSKKWGQTRPSSSSKSNAASLGSCRNSKALHAQAAHSTLEQARIVREMGRLSSTDRKELRIVLQKISGRVSKNGSILYSRMNLIKDMQMSFRFSFP